MDRRVTPPKRVISPTWGPPPLHVDGPLVPFSNTEGTIVTPKRKLKTIFIQNFVGKNCLIGNVRGPNFKMCGFCASY